MASATARLASRVAFVSARFRIADSEEAMSVKKKLGQALVYALLTIGAMCGVPMRPEQIEKLMRVMNETCITHVVKKDDQ